MNTTISNPASSSAPEDIVVLAEQRADARIERDWSTADELKARIEAAGWKVIDEGASFTLAPVRAPDIVAGGRTLYGHPDAVPTALDAPVTTVATVVVVGDGAHASLATTLAAVTAEAPAGTQRIVVLDSAADGSDPVPTPGADSVAPTRTLGTESVIKAPAPRAEGSALGPTLDADEIVWTAGRLNPGAALQAGVRRATGAIIIALAPGHVPSGDFVSPLVAALDDPAIGVVGANGLRSADLHHFARAESGAVTALAAGCVAFRREDLIERGPLDERLRLANSVATWWSLVLRDEGEGARARSALAIDLPLVIEAADAAAKTTTAVDIAAKTGTKVPRDRRAARDRYRISDRFGGRLDLAT